MTGQSFINKVPKHLQKYVVEQDYSSYTPEDQAAWRFVMIQLKSYLARHAHSCYIDGLAKTGITTETIPSIYEIDKCLKKFGWSAVPVSGFIPPAAFMEFQAKGFLPIASDMRSVEHILYTPAPDIVHEAAGHAPILVNQDFANYLKEYADIASKAIISSEDLAIYEAIRVLSDAKENPYSKKEEVKKLNEELNLKSQAMTFISEANLLSRMNWWTAEYGLIGEEDNLKIYGAGLLSSIGESRSCLLENVAKIPLSVSCVDFSYDITEKQPQLFWAKDFKQLSQVLQELSRTMSYRVGGLLGVQRAIQAKSVNTVELDTGLQISGECIDQMSTHQDLHFVRFTGPTQISIDGTEIKGHGKEYHKSGYSSPLGKVIHDGQLLDLSYMENLEKLSIKTDQDTLLVFESGIQLSGKLLDKLVQDERCLLMKFENCKVIYRDKILFDPTWGEFDLALGTRVVSVFGGPADREAYGHEDNFSKKSVPKRDFSPNKIELFDLYKQIRKLRDSNSISIESVENLFARWQKRECPEWLPGLELLELCKLSSDNNFAQLYETIFSQLMDENNYSTAELDCLCMGIEYINSEVII